MTSSFDQRLQEMKIALPDPPNPVGAYKPLLIHGKIAYLSGQIPKTPEGSLIRGKVGGGLSIEQGQFAARTAALNVISLIRRDLGFDRFERILRIVGYVQCTPEFDKAHEVMNGASELFAEVFGDAGIHVRSAVGMVSLPLNAAVEIEATIAIK